MPQNYIYTSRFSEVVENHSFTNRQVNDYM